MREALREGERERERVKVAIIAMMKSRGGRKGVIYSLLIWPDRRSESPIHAVSRRHDYIVVTVRERARKGNFSSSSS